MKDSMRHKDGSHCADRATCRRAHLYMMTTTLPPLTTQPSEPRRPCGTVGCILWTDHVAPCVTGDELIVSINDKETVLRERDAWRAENKVLAERVTRLQEAFDMQQTANTKIAEEAMAAHFRVGRLEMALRDAIAQLQSIANRHLASVAVEHLIAVADGKR
jgi:hypothetical protein